MRERSGPPKLKIWRIPRWIALIPLSRSEGAGLLVLVALLVTLFVGLVLIIR